MKKKIQMFAALLGAIALYVPIRIIVTGIEATPAVCASAFCLAMAAGLVGMISSEFQ